jgi:hypothetical protein
VTVELQIEGLIPEEEELDEEAEEAIVGVAATTLIPPTLFVLYAVTNETVDTNLR